MRIAVIGAGFTGLSCAYTLLKTGHNVTVFEKDPSPGGLAIGFKPARHQLSPKTNAGGDEHWKWSLEKHYHHWFTNDNSVLSLADEIGYDVITKRPKTSVFIDSRIYQLDSPSNLLTLPSLTTLDKLRMASALASLRYNPFWKPLEKIKAAVALPKMMGDAPYKKIWEPLLVSKFGRYSSEISLAWFWARIKKRTPSLAYPRGGFLEFANALVAKIEEMGGKVHFNKEVAELKSNGNVSLKFSLQSREIKDFEKVIVTLPSFFFLKIAHDLPQDYKNKLLMLKGLGAANLILRLKKPFLTDGAYWLSVCDKKSPIMAIVEHTNFMDKKFYNNERIVYLGNYLPHDHPYMKMGPEELMKAYNPYLKKINPTYRLSLIAYHLFKVPFAQPIIPVNYSKIIPPFETPLKNVYLANIQQVYPWDRGTNYAVELGEKVARLIK